MTQIKRINADLIRENLPNPRHVCAIKNVAVLYNSIFQRSPLLVKVISHKNNETNNRLDYDVWIR